MSNLFSVKSELCGERFELKINDVRFVGHPTKLIDSQKLKKDKKRPPKKESSTIVLFNIVFALRVCILFIICSIFQ